VGAKTSERPTRRSRGRGCIVGLAVGDAFGAPVEFKLRDEILAEFPPTGIGDLVPWREFAAGSYTDDTQMSIATARGIRDWQAATGWRGPVAGGEADIEVVAPDGGRERTVRGGGAGDAAAPDLDALRLAIWERYLEWHRSPDWIHRAPGDTCMAALAAGIPGGAHDVARNGSKGCGGVMRVAPLGLIGLGAAAFAAGVDAAALTHGAVTSDTSSGFQALLIDRLVAGLALGEAVAAARAVLAAHPGSVHSLAAVDAAVALAASSEAPYAAIAQIGSSGHEAPGERGKGWVADEALGIGLFAALRYRDDVRGAFGAAANISGDSDSTASIAGAILGAWLGLEAIPSDWVAQLENREMLLGLADELVDGAD
jgi:ADP-ribosyl-[dinitrogen reductase] hydrolase